MHKQRFDIVFAAFWNWLIQQLAAAGQQYNDSNSDMLYYGLKQYFDNPNTCGIEVIKYIRQQGQKKNSCDYYLLPDRIPNNHPFVALLRQKRIVGWQSPAHALA